MLTLMGFNSEQESAIGACFRRMSIAEEEIATAKRRCPRKAKALHASFGILYTSTLARFSDDIYRSHVRELLARVMRREDTRLATDAELLAMFSETSLRAPLASSYANAMSVVFHSVFPHADMNRFQAGHAAYPKDAEEIITAARKRLAHDRGPR